MSNTETTILYALSTLAQTCAALAAFVGAVGIFRLQVLWNQRRDAEQELRVLASRVTTVQQNGLPLPISDVVEGVKKARQRAEQPENRSNQGYQDNVRAAENAVASWRAFEYRSGESRAWLIAFETWNIVVIFASIIGFNHLAWLSGSEWTLRTLWPVAGITAAITGYCVFIWTKG